MSENLKKIQEITSSEYKYGFKTKIKEDRIPNGLSEDIVRKISSIKNEPQWLLDWRLKGFKHWLKMKDPKCPNLK